MDTQVMTRSRTKNRPLVSDYCYNCGSTGACKKWRGLEGCVQYPRPLMLEIHEQVERSAAIKAMTSAQRADVLGLLAMMDPKRFDFAVAHRIKGES